MHFILTGIKTKYDFDKLEKLFGNSEKIEFESKKNLYIVIDYGYIVFKKWVKRNDYEPLTIRINYEVFISIFKFGMYYIGEKNERLQNKFIRPTK